MKARIQFVAATIMLAVACATPAMAQDSRILTLPEGHTLLNIAATERAQVQQDLLIASLRIEHEAADAKAVQDHINRVMAKALEQAKTAKGVEVSTGGYHVYQYTKQPPVNLRGEVNGEGKPVWRGTQTIDLKSTAADTLLNLAGELQKSGLIMNNLSYMLSPAKADEAKDALMEEALSKVKARAERAAKAMGKGQAEMVEITVDAADNMIPAFPVMRAMAMGDAKMEMAAPVAEPGLADITLTVSARVLLKP